MLRALIQGIKCLFRLNIAKGIKKSKEFKDRYVVWTGVKFTNKIYAVKLNFW